MTETAPRPAPRPAPRIVLATPPRAEPEALTAALAPALEAGLIATLRLDLPGAREDALRRAADRLRELCHAADTAFVIRDHYRLVRPLGLDGAQVAFREASLKKVRAEIGPDAILGAACGGSRHDGMTAAEAAADYVLFSPVVPDPALGDDASAPLDLFEWWAEMIEVPVVAEGGIGEAEARALGPHADFIVPDPRVWQGDLAANLAGLAAALEG